MVEVLTAVVISSTVFWDITPCNPLKVNGRFGGTYRLHLQVRARYPCEGQQDATTHNYSCSYPDRFVETSEKKSVRIAGNAGDI
jgi:hypothetical protein